MMLFACMVAIGVVLVVLFEGELLEVGALAGTDSQSEFAVLGIMEVLTILFIPLSLRLFKFKKIERQLQTFHASALLKWGVVRLLMLGVPMLANTLLYYIYMNTSFGYMAIIILLCLPFIFPTTEKCSAEAFVNESEQNEA